MIMNQKNEKRKIIRNSLILYVRLFLVLIGNLYISRVVLNALGVSDFGIYNAIGGFVILFTVLSNSMSASCNRFLAVELGAKDLAKLKKTFNTSVIVHYLLAIVILLIVEPIGIWFVNNHMVFSIERIHAANVVLQCSIITFILNIISVPYNASIISHEDMDAYAFISITEVSLKVITAFIISHVEIDRLALYAILLMIIAIVIRIVYSLYCIYKYTECKLALAFDRGVLKNMLSFAGWNFIGSVSGISKDQGINVLLNLYFGVLVNSAYGLASQIRSAVMNFSSGLMSAINPQIIKSYSRKDYSYMLELIFKGSKYSFFLMLVIAVPFLMNTEYILYLWLKNIPKYTTVFVELFIVSILIESYSFPLITAMLATGNIRNYQLVVGGLQCAVLPLSWLLLKMGYSPESIFVLSIVMTIIVMLARIYMLKSIIPFSPLLFGKEVIAPTMFVGCLSVIASFFLAKIICFSPDWHFIILFISSFVVTSMFILSIGMTNSERNSILSKLNIK